MFGSGYPCKGCGKNGWFPGDVCSVACRAKVVREGLAHLSAPKDQPTEMQRLLTQARADGERLGHQFFVCWSHYFVNRRGRNASVYCATCFRCGDDVTVEEEKTFDKARVRGPAVAIRCTGKWSV